MLVQIRLFSRRTFNASNVAKIKGAEVGPDRITGQTLAFFMGNHDSTASTDIGYEYKWCPSSNKMGVTTCGVTDYESHILVETESIDNYPRRC